MMPTSEAERITNLVAQNFRTFGGGRRDEFNPLANALADSAPMFAAGVDVAEVVMFVLKERRKGYVRRRNSKVLR